MKEDFEQQMCVNDGDDDSEWSRPVEVCDSVKPDTSKVSNNRTVLHNQSRSVPKCDHPKIIVHIDVDCFYAQVEMIHNPALRDVPLGIQQKYLVVTCNYPARARGVTKLMGIAEAKKKCPELVLVSGEDLTRYREMSYKISEFLMKYTPYVERLGFDENYLDVTEMVKQRVEGGTAGADVVGHVYSPQGSDSESDPSVVKTCSCGCHCRLAVGSQIAADIRSALNIELGITGCAGIAHNKLLAKVVGSQHKPNQQTTIYPCHALFLITGLHSARHIPGVGWATSKRLKALGVDTVIDLQQFPLRQLEEEFGVAMATTISQLSFAVDDSPVVTYGRPQMLSIEDSFRRCSSEKDAELRVTHLLTNLLPRMQEDGRTPHTLRLTVRKANKENRYLHRESRQCNIPSGFTTKIATGQLEVVKKHLVTMAMSLFRKMVNTKQPFHLTLINVAFAKLEETANNNITSFFTSQPTPDVVSPSSQHHNGHPDDDSGSTPKSPLLKMKTTAHNITDNSKRRHSGDLTCFFGKKPKVLDEAVDCAQPAAQAVGTCKGQNGQPSAGSSREVGNVLLPLDVDPEVFVQLPLDIQQEILQTVSQQRSANGIQQVAGPSTSQCAHRDRSPSPRSSGEKRTVDGNLCVQTKKAIFSPTKSKVRKMSSVQSVLGENELLSTKTNDQSHFFPQVDHVMKGTRITDKEHNWPAAEADPEYHSSHTLNKKSSQTLNKDVSFFSQEDFQDCQKPDERFKHSDAKLHSSGVGSKQAETYSKSNTKTCQDKNSSLIHSIHNPKTSVPKGVAPDVFSALPPEIQREVAAEMAIQKHNVVSSAGTIDVAGLRKSQMKSPAKQVNSMLNYLKKR